MKHRFPDDVREQSSHEEAPALAAAWDALDQALPEPPSARMRRRFRRLVRRELVRSWSPALPWAGMAAMLLLGVAVGRFTATPATEPLDLPPEARLLSGAMTGLRLQAMISLRDAGTDLPADTIEQLGRVLANADANMGLRLAALDALLAHRDQPAVRSRLTQARSAIEPNPMLEARLEETGAPAA